MADDRPPRRGLAAFLTGQTDDTSEPEPVAARPRATNAPLFPQDPPRRAATRAIRPAAAAPPAPAPVAMGPDGDEVPIIALPDHAAPPGAVVSAGHDANGIEYVFEDDPSADPLVDPRYDADDRNWVRYRTSWGSFLRLVGFALIVLVLVLIVRSRIYGWIDAQIEPGGPQGETVAFTIADGAAVNDIATDLANAGVIHNATVFRYWLRCDGDITISGFLGCDKEVSFQAGDYELFENMSYQDAVAVLEEGPIPEVFYKVTIPEGLRVLPDFVDRMLEENDRFDRDQLLEALVDPDLVSDFLPEGLSSFVWHEGLLFPATYDIPENDIADEARLIGRMTDEFDRRFSGLLEELGRPPEAEELGLTDYEIVIVASLIERESKVAADRDQMARVIYNRLRDGVPLQIDATVYYGLGKSFTEGLTQSELDTPTDYNTYLNVGLPPTPIGAPGEASLRAALRPNPNPDLYYWVRTDEGGVLGAHTFSTNLDDHNAAVEVCRELGYCG